MLTLDLKAIGDRLYKTRKAAGLTQAEIAEAANISDRTYADIERGTANMRIETMMRICRVLNVTPNDILIEPTTEIIDERDILSRLSSCSPRMRMTALELLNVYISSV